jgi:hypothetical protein
MQLSEKDTYDEDQNRKYKDLIALYGVKNYKELIDLGPTVQMAEKSMSKKKDTSKLQLVQKTVIRRGKPTQMSFYQDPSKQSGAPEAKNTSKGNNDEADSGIEDGVYIASKELGNPLPTNVLKAIPRSGWYQERKYKKSYDYLFFVSGGQVVATSGVGKLGDSLTVSFVGSYTKESYYNYLYLAICATIDIAYKNGFGFYFKTKNQAEIDMLELLRDFYSIKKLKGVYQIPLASMEKVFGERVWKH